MVSLRFLAKLPLIRLGVISETEKESLEMNILKWSCIWAGAGKDDDRVRTNCKTSPIQ